MDATVISEQTALNDAVSALYNAVVASGPTQVSVLGTDDDKATAVSAALPELFPTPADALEAAYEAAAYGDVNSDGGTRYPVLAPGAPSTNASRALPPSWLLLFLDIITATAPSVVPDRAAARTLIDRVSFVPSEAGQALGQLLFRLA